jgi:SAM-dependent methyltransferase
VELDQRVRSYYELGREAHRLHRPGGGALELARTRELVTAALPTTDGPLDVLDVGGAAGVHAAWLAELGHHVTIVDPVDLHVEQARAAGIPAELGDARALPQVSASHDVVLLLGPLYHLQDDEDRATALAEAWRVLRPGGLLAAAAIGRHAAYLDLLLRFDRLTDPEVLPVVERVLATGRFDGWEPALFTHAYLHLPDELEREVAGAGFVDVRLHNVEGPGAFAADVVDRWQDATRREALLTAARLTDDHPSLLHVASHLLAFGRRPS